MGCQKKIAEEIVEQEADYLLAVKDNQPNLHIAHQNYFWEAFETNFEGYNIDYAQTFNKGHGRLEQRRCWVGYDVVPNIDSSQDWKKLETIVMVESIRTIDGKTTIEHRYYISREEYSASKLLNASREHWFMPNSLHWRLDIAYRVR